MEKPSQWILKRAKEKAENEWRANSDLHDMGVKEAPAIPKWTHVQQRFGWFIPEATLEYLDTVHNSLALENKKAEQK